MGKIEERSFRTCGATIDLLLFGVKKRKKEQADVKKEQVVYEMNRMGNIEESSFRTCGATVSLLLFWGSLQSRCKKRSKLNVSCGQW